MDIKCERGPEQIKQLEKDEKQEINKNKKSKT